MDFEKLTNDAREARKQAVLAADSSTDGGTCNLDAAFFPLPKYDRGTKLVAALSAAGLSASVTRWHHSRGVMVSPPGGGIANKRCASNGAFINHMQACGYDVHGYYQMD